MLATGRYAQWRSTVLTSTRNKDQMVMPYEKCILTGPYTPTMVTTPVGFGNRGSPEVPQNIIETSSEYDFLRTKLIMRI
ncbi:hypothetical protein Tco_0735581 [Tanacetum coccineum]